MYLSKEVMHTGLDVSFSRIVYPWCELIMENTEIVYQFWMYQRYGMLHTCSMPSCTTCDLSMSHSAYPALIARRKLLCIHTPHGTIRSVIIVLLSIVLRLKQNFIQIEVHEIYTFIPFVIFSVFFYQFNLQVKTLQFFIVKNSN